MEIAVASAAVSALFDALPALAGLPPVAVLHFATARVLAHVAVSLHSAYVSAAAVRAFVPPHAGVPDVVVAAAPAVPLYGPVADYHVVPVAAVESLTAEFVAPLVGSPLVAVLSVAALPVAAAHVAYVPAVDSLVRAFGSAAPAPAPADPVFAGAAVVGFPAADGVVNSPAAAPAAAPDLPVPAGTVPQTLAVPVPAGARLVQVCSRPARS